MFAIPLIIVASDETHQFHDGLLLTLHPELGGKSKIARYASLSTSGWHVIEHGYSAFVQQANQGERFVFIGLNPYDLKPTKKLEIPKFFTKSKFEEYISSLLARESLYRDKAEANLNLLVHDLRRLSASIYHAAEQAKSYMADGDAAAASVRIENVIATQSMLRIRTDVLDFSGNPNAEQVMEAIPIYRRVDKVVKCFTPISERKGTKISIQGPSFAESLGPNVFEIIPYVLIDNAVKYAPSLSNISVTVLDLTDEIVLTVESLGPDISPNERDRIFERGVRGDAAKTIENSGSGVGLFLAKSLIQKFGGTISVEVSDSQLSYQQHNYHNVTFEVRLPVYKPKSNDDSSLEYRSHSSLSVKPRGRGWRTQR